MSPASSIYPVTGCRRAAGHVPIAEWLGRPRSEFFVSLSPVGLRIVGCKFVGCRYLGCRYVGCRYLGCRYVGCRYVGCRCVGCMSVAAYLQPQHFFLESAASAPIAKSRGEEHDWFFQEALAQPGAKSQGVASLPYRTDTRIGHIHWRESNEISLT